MRERGACGSYICKRQSLSLREAEVQPPRRGDSLVAFCEVCPRRQRFDVKDPKNLKHRMRYMRAGLDVLRYCDEVGAR